MNFKIPPFIIQANCVVEMPGLKMWKSSSQLAQLIPRPNMGLEELFPDWEVGSCSASLRNPGMRAGAGDESSRSHREGP